jgi:hypothetical protein
MLVSYMYTLQCCMTERQQFVQRQCADLCVRTTFDVLIIHSTSLIGGTLGDYGAVFAQLNNGSITADPPLQHK